MFLGKNTRPDVSLYDVKLLMGLKGSDKSLQIAPGQKLYLSYSDKHLNFAKDSTPLWIKPYLNEKGETWLEMGAKLASESGEVLLDEVRSYEIEASLSKGLDDTIKDPVLAAGWEEMKKGKWWAPDKLFEGYGGADYSALVGSERLEFEEGYFLYVKEGDTFTWKDGKWQKSNETKGHPIARLSNLSPYKMDWELWDTSGLEKVKVSQMKEKVSGISLRVEEIFTRMRQRTSSRVSCQVDNKAVILKKGDWLIHTSAGWFILRSLKEVETVLDFKVKGELFVFDGLEKVDGKAVFCGTLFDTMRTQMQPVRLPVIQPKNTEHSPPTKKSISTKIRPATSEEQTTSKKKCKRPHQKTRQRKEPIDDYGEE